mmetsp:Transcript_3112/g.6503  ORF Transcript_3112/g.6503 Transcript_3112/m.6503 type:complete len:106 (-) Transcript_3112:220-537(-)
MEDRPWLRTVPEMTQAEWEMEPTEAPTVCYCVCCHFFAFGHKDVIAKKKEKVSVRRDRIAEHEKDGKHARVVQKWELMFGPLDPEEGGGEGRNGPTPATTVEFFE